MQDLYKSHSPWFGGPMPKSSSEKPNDNAYHTRNATPMEVWVGKAHNRQMNEHKQFGIPREALPSEKKEAGLTKSSPPGDVFHMSSAPEPRFSSVPPPADGQSLTFPVKRHATDTHKAAPICFENETENFREFAYPEDGP